MLRWFGQIILSIVFIGAVRGAESNPLLDCIDPEVRLERSPLPEDQNAFTYWQKAANAFVPLADADKELFDRLTIGNLPISINADEFKRSENWLARNDVSLKFLETGILCSECRFPIMKALEEIRPYLNSLRSLARLKIARSVLLRLKTEHAQSLNEILDVIKTGELIGNAGGLTDYCLGYAIQRIGLDALQRTANCGEVPEKYLQRAFKAISAKSNQDEDFANACRGDFYAFFYEPCRQIPDHTALPETQVLVVSELFSTDVSSSLLQHHPKPLDPRSTISLASSYFAAIIRQSRLPFQHRSKVTEQRFENDKRAWNEEWISCFEKVSAKKKDKRDLTREDRIQVERDLAKIENPLGKMMTFLIIPVSFTLTRQPVSLATARETTRTLLAIRIYERRNETLPRSLERLVENGILKSVPVDPYSEKPLLYSRQKRLIWSVGEDDIDHGGDGNTKTHFEGKDYVREIPQIIKAAH